MPAGLIAKILLKILGNKKSRKFLFYGILGVVVAIILVPTIMLYSIKALFGKKIHKDFDITKTEIYEDVEAVYKEWLDSKKKEMEDKAHDLEEAHKYWVEDNSNDESGGSSGHYEYPVRASIALNDVSKAYFLAYYSVTYEKSDQMFTKKYEKPKEEEIKSLLDKITVIEETWADSNNCIYSNKTLEMDEILKVLFEENKAKSTLFKSSFGNFESFISKVPSDSVTEGNNNGGIQIDGVAGNINAQNYQVPQNGGNNSVVYYQQNGGQAWSGMRFGGKNIGNSGCSVTCLSMVISYTSGTNVYPSDVVNKIAEKNDGNYNKFYAGDKGQSWDIFPKVASYYGLQCNKISSSSIMQSLRDGKPVIMSCKPGEFTTKGHFIVLTGLTSDGFIVVNDPAHPDKSFKKYTLEFIKSQGKGFWSF